MGTRHLIAVVADGEYKVAQYGQWDGYPSGQGETVLDFLTTADLSVFGEKVRKCTFITEEAYLQLWYECGLKPGEEYADSDVSSRFKNNYSHLGRDCGGNILQVVYDSDEGLALQDALYFAGESLFCEWAYVIDLDNNRLEVFKGFNKIPLEWNERFFDLPTDHPEYLQVRLVKAYPLDALPTLDELIADCDPEKCDPEEE